MKFLFVICTFIFAISAQAKTSQYVCKMQERLQFGAEFENVNDFSFEDTPFLVIERVDGALNEVSVGAMVYNQEDGYEFIQSIAPSQITIQIVFHDDLTQASYKIMSVLFPQDGSESPVVFSHEKETDGPIAEFGFCIGVK